MAIEKRIPAMGVPQKKMNLISATISFIGLTRGVNKSCFFSISSSMIRKDVKREFCQTLMNSANKKNHSPLISFNNLWNCNELTLHKSSISTVVNNIHQKGLERPITSIFLKIVPFLKPFTLWLN